MILHSKLLAQIPGLVHGFSTRLGGFSTGPGASFDLSRGSGSDLAENRRRFALENLGLSALEQLIEVEQVHGVAVASEEASATTCADAIVTARPGVAVGVRTADCAPILVAALSDAGRPLAVAAIHAGWRGAVAGVVPRGIERLVALGADAANMRAAIGPTIGLAAFEVGPEVIEAARQALGGEEPRMSIGANGRPHLDLVDLVERQLLSAGVRPEHIERVGGCTHDTPALFFSHRRDRGQTGRQLSAIGLRAE